jgi:hypothetical protein
MKLNLNWRTWPRTIRSLGYDRVLLFLAIVLVLISLAAPLWSVSLFHDSANYSTTDFTWTGTTTQSFSGGVLNTITIQPYGAPLFPLKALASSISSAYAVMAGYAALLVAVLVIYSRPLGRRLPPLGHLIVSLVVVALAFVALLYPTFALPSQASANLGIPSLTSFFGASPVTSAVNRPAGSVASSLSTATWGAGLGWWFLLVGVVFGILGAVVPYLRMMFRPIPPPPAGWQPRQ